MSYIFGGNTGLTYEQAKRKREIAEALVRGNNRAPQNVGEGLHAIGQAFLARGLRKKADEAEAKGRAGAQQRHQSALGAILGGQTSMPPPQGNNYRDAIAAIESRGSGDYSALGPVMSKGSYTGDRAYGRYQVMGNNIPSWTREALGQSMTPEQFLADPKAQDAVFDHHFGKSVQQYGNPQDAASVWFTGKPVSKAGNVSDGHTTAPEYIQKFNAALGQQPQGGTQVADNGATVQQIMAALADPWVSDAQKSGLQIALEQKMQANDPMRQAQLRKAQLDIERMENPQPQTTDDIREYEFARKQGYQGTFADFMQAIRKSGAPNISNVVNTGDHPDARPMADKPPKGFQRRYDDRIGSWVDEPIPGSEAEYGRQEVETKRGETSRQSRLKLGTALTSIGLNLAEIEDGGLPVTGAIGDMRRTFVGRAITGSGAYDFGNRTNQITDAAAFDEIQRMRDNSPTGGAVGQLTDKERAAIGNAVTALNSSTSAEEYQRAANAYRNLSLDLSYGAGQWALGENADEVIVGPQSAQGFGDFGNASMQDLLDVDINALTPEQEDAWEARLQALQGGNR